MENLEEILRNARLYQEVYRLSRENLKHNEAARNEARLLLKNFIRIIILKTVSNSEAEAISVLSDKAMLPEVPELCFGDYLPEVITSILLEESKFFKDVKYNGITPIFKDAAEVLQKNFFPQLQKKLSDFGVVFSVEKRLDEKESWKKYFLVVKIMKPV